jgi:hypothetical protein
MAMAADIIDSMNPDADHDGILERSGALQEAGENIDKLLPQDEQERRRKADRKGALSIFLHHFSNNAPKQNGLSISMSLRTFYY